MKNCVIIVALLLFSSVQIIAQNIEKQERLANDELREGNTLFEKSNYADAEVSYKKSVATYPNNPNAIYNLGNAMIQQKRYKEAIAQYDYLSKSAKSNALKAKSFHNIGNANMGLNEFQKAVDAYKNSLRINHKDEETRYNLALAQELLKQQQEQNKDNKDQNKDKQDKNKDDKENKDDQKKDEADDENKKDEDKNNDQDKKDKEDQEDKSEKDKQNKKDENKDQQQPQPGKLTPEQMKQLLEAMQNEENKTQDKMNAKKIKGNKIKTEKDW